VNARQAKRLKRLVASLKQPLFQRPESFDVINKAIDRYTVPSCKSCGRELVDGERRRCTDCILRDGS
jgi:hypothetical protein